MLKARFVDELSYQQIGERIGMTVEAVRKALFRNKKQVRSCVENQPEGGSMNENNEWEELVERHLRGRTERAGNRASRGTARQRCWGAGRFCGAGTVGTPELLRALRESRDSPQESDVVLAGRLTAIRERLPRTTLLRTLLAVSVVVIVTLSAGLFYQQSTADRRIAEIAKNTPAAG